MSRLMPWIEKIGSELREDISAAKTVPALSAGFTSGLGLLVSHIAGVCRALNMKALSA